jgi:hypothetical protein
MNRHLIQANPKIIGRELFFHLVKQMHVCHQRSEYELIAGTKRPNNHLYAPKHLYIQLVRNLLLTSFVKNFFVIAKNLALS